MSTGLNRRQFLQQVTLSGAGLLLANVAFARSSKLSPNEKLNIGVIGVAHQGNYNLSNVTSENIVALCDVDDTFLAAAAQKFPGAKTYNDFR
ncbi:MAG TPA: twin-arginine translocation signal domain-containing protein, partial [Bacillota bacterium]|nr:twin-arginine translocation signal domain-containing protein [Bacillota bacterium]